jgi:nitrite reductase/ring-hydroxylating ferredoxin subunit
VKPSKLLLFLFLLLVSACGKEEDYIPSVPVSFRASLSDPRLSSLTNGGGVVVLLGYGVSGLIICRRPDNNAYVAFDRCSTVNPSKKCALVPDNSGYLATDPCSGGKFSLLDGTAMRAPASRPLKQYQVYTDNFTITVSN